MNEKRDNSSVKKEGTKIKQIWGRKKKQGIQMRRWIRRERKEKEKRSTLGRGGGEKVKKDDLGWRKNKVRLEGEREGGTDDKMGIGEWKGVRQEGKKEDLRKIIRGERWKEKNRKRTGREYKTEKK